MRLAYFVQDVFDPAVERRVRMFRAGGAEVVVLGFRRSQIAIEDVAGAEVVDLGRTYSGQLARRAYTVARRLASPGRWAHRLGDVDAVVARSLETLVLASAARAHTCPSARLVYECLDIHSLMVANNPVGVALRSLEDRLLRHCQLLIVSSPAFITHYFEPRLRVGRRPGLQTLLLENKLVRLDEDSLQPRPAGAGPPPGPPWRLGWFGVLRCRRSLEALGALVQRRPDLLSLRLAGRPARHELPDFEPIATATPGVEFSGPYARHELADLYGSVHFTWAVDYYEAGGNSEWLLPNRIYEGGWFGTPAIARADTETGRWLQDRGLGVTLADPVAGLEPFLEGLTPERYLDLRAALSARPDSDFAADEADCVSLVRAITRDQIGAGGRPIA